MAWWTTALMEAAPYIYSGVTGLLQGSRQSELTPQYALANSIAINQAGSANAKSVLAIGRLNSASQIAAAKATNMRIRELTKYNAEQTSFLGDYNAQVLENEALLVLESVGIDLRQLAREHERAAGDIKAAHGASGAIMGQDTAGVVMDDVRRQQELETFVVKRGADVRVTKLLDQAALSRYQGFQEANKITFEGALMEQSNIVNAGLSAFGTSAQARIDAVNIKNNAAIQASQMFQKGMLQSDQYAYAGSSAFWSGLFGASTSFASSYIDNKRKTQTYQGVTSLLGSESTTGFGDRTSVIGGMGGV